jgi:microcystin degradation protein MlrC
MGGVSFSTGPTAVLQAGAVQIMVASLPSYDYAGEQYAAAGIRLEDFDVVVFKNGMNFRTLLQPDSSFVLLDGVGSSSGNLAKLPWQNRPRPFWPRDRELRTPFQPQRQART